MMSGELLTEQQAITGLKVALRIIAGWDATQRQACRILRISPATYRRATRGFAAGQRLDQDQHQRMGWVLGIHAYLRKIFSNPENVKGFPGFKNNNPFFAGRSPRPRRANHHPTVRCHKKLDQESEKALVAYR